jgi:phage shock protein A
VGDVLDEAMGRAAVQIVSAIEGVVTICRDHIRKEARIELLSEIESRCKERASNALGAEKVAFEGLADMLALSREVNG